MWNEIENCLPCPKIYSLLGEMCSHIKIQVSNNVLFKQKAWHFLDVITILASIEAVNITTRKVYHVS